MEAFSRLGIDGWSMLLYLVNIGLLLGLLTKLLYKPLLRVMDERRDTIEKQLKETEHLRKMFEVESKKQAKETKELVLKMQAEVMTAKSQAEARAKELMAEADAERERLLDAARAEAEQMKQGVLKAAEKETQKRIEQTILHVLQNKLPKEVVQESVKAAWKELYT
jgi:F-type H+-transporting ATPase subunit b